MLRKSIKKNKDIKKKKDISSIMLPKSRLGQKWKTWMLLEENRLTEAAEVSFGKLVWI